ncbi:DUF1707 SHOCT-like domain-containing protein [Actinomycetospora flava]|uniref:DUF1707 domain-containing protein n=1 Tax=Actinomycetospora flava TaxID=3129232 RepID=A0ABU8M3T8_9PSEU
MSDPGPQEPSDPERRPAVTPGPPPMRASDSEREQVAEVVREAVADGRLTIVEGDERLRDVYAAVYRRDLAPVTADLQPVENGTPTAASPASPVRRPAGRLDRPASTTSVAVLSGVTKRGDWTPGHTHRVIAFWGGAELYFRDARLDEAGLSIGAIAIMGGVTIDLRGIPAGVEVTIQAVAIMGGIDVTVDPDTTVVEDGLGFMGAFEDGSGAARRADGPRVRVTGLALMGGVSVNRKPLELEGSDRRALEE